MSSKNADRRTRQVEVSETMVCAGLAALYDHHLTGIIPPDNELVASIFQAMLAARETT